MIKYLKRFGLLTKITLIVAISPFILLWGECFTRMLFPQNLDSKMDIFASDTIIGFTYKPNASTFEKGSEYNALYQINSIGLRDREYDSKQDGIFRVLLLGDSFSVSHGLPIEDSLSRQMENALQKMADSNRDAIKFEVINAAAGGYSPYNYWKAYRRWAPVFKPDIVIVGLSPDDYECDNENVHYIIENGEILGFYRGGKNPPKNTQLSTKKLRKWLSWHSQFYVLMRNFFYYNEIVTRIALWKNPGGVENDFQLKLYMVSNQANINNAWSKTFSYLRALKKETAADGVMLILVPIPLKMEIDHGQYRQVLTNNGLKNEQIDLNQQLNAISTFCMAEKIQTLDPRLAMRERHSDVPCYFVLDGHWNAEGVRVASVSLAKQLRDLGVTHRSHFEAKSVNK